MRGIWNDHHKSLVLGLWLLAPGLAALSTDQVQGAAASFSLLGLSLLLLVAPLVPLASPRRYFLLLTPLALLVAPYCYLTLAYRSVPGDALISAVLNTNWSTSLAMLAAVGWIVWLVPLSLLIYIAVARSISNNWRLPWEARKRLLAGVLMYTMVGMAGRQFLAQHIKLPPMFEDATISLAFPSGLATSLLRIGTKHVEQGQYASVHGRSEIGDEPLLVVMVVGETLRADHLGLYGYARNTTPLLSAMRDELVTFPDVASTANWTNGALPYLLSWQWQDGAAHSAPIVKTFSEAGFRTAWLSNQNGYSIGLGADVLDYISYFRERTDANLLPLFTSFLRQAGQRQFAVLHMYGSHSPYEYRYEAASRVFTPTMRDLGIETPRVADKQAVINSYDNTVVETDKFLAGVIAELRKEQRPAVMLFTSDHGENLFDDERALWMHSMNYPTRADTHVPLLVWANNAYRQRFPQRMAALQANRSRKLSHLQVFPTMMDLGGVAWDGRDARRSFASPQFQESERIVQVDLGRVTDYEQLK